MDPYFKKFSFINQIERTYAKYYNNNAPSTSPVSTKSRKRGRSEWEDENNDELVREILIILHNEDAFPTFHSLLSEQLYKIVSVSEQNPYYQQLLNIIVDFRYLMAQTEQLYLNPMKQYDFYFFMIDDVNTFLQRSKHSILLFHLSQVNP